MGWRIILQADRPIAVADVERVVEGLPSDIRHYGIRNSWGWTTAVDINEPNGSQLSLSGSFTQSGRIASGAAQAVARLLEHQGYTIEIGELTG